MISSYNIPKWKTSAMRSFWIDYSTTKFDINKLGTRDEFVESFSWYLDVKDTERLKGINRKMGGFVTSEEIRNKAMQDWTKFNRKITEREEQNKMERDAYQVLSDVEWAVNKASEAVESNR